MKENLSVAPFYEETSTSRSKRVRNYRVPETSAARFNLLIVGTGMIGREHMYVTYLLGRARVYGIYDKHESSMDAAETAYRSYCSEPLIRYTDLDSACQDPAIDAILICTPNFTHFDVVAVAAKSGKPLFIEKPMATNIADAARMVRLADEYPAFVQIGMQYRYKAQYVDAFHEIKKMNALGAVKTIAMCEYRPPFLDKVEQWNKFNRYSGGTLVEKCCHYFDLINLMAGAEAESVYASGGQAVNFVDFEYEGRKSDIDDHAFVIINFKNGLRANFILNMFAQELFEEMVVTGERGCLVATENASFNADTPSKARIMVEVAGHDNYKAQEITYPAKIERSGHHGATFFEHEAMIDQLEQKPVDSASPLQGLWALIVASAAQESLASGEVTRIDDFIARHELGSVVGREA